MTLQNILEITKDSHARLETGAITVNLAHDETDYWHLSDYAVSSRAGMMLVLTPRQNPACDCGQPGHWQGDRCGLRMFACASCYQAMHADNGWQHHYQRP